MTTPHADPVIRYARTADGFDIAHSSLGDGAPIVCLPSVPFSNLQTEWRIPEAHAWYSRLATELRVIRFDARGTGLSDRSASAFSLDTFADDLDAVLDQIEVGPVALWGTFSAGPAAIEYAVRHPDRVSHLVLWAVAARSEQLMHHPRTAGLLSLVSRDWELFTNSAAHQWMGWGSGESATRAAEHFRSCCTQPVAEAYLQLNEATDVTDRLAAVEVPTLVLHRRDVQEVQIEHSRALAAGIPGAHLRLVAGDSPAPFMPDAEALVDAIIEFVAPPSVEPARPPIAATSGGAPTGAAADWGLTDRERDVLALIVAGHSNREIADQLVVEVSTVKTHVSNVLTKLGARSRGQAIAIAHAAQTTPKT